MNVNKKLELLDLIINKFEDLKDLTRQPNTADKTEQTTKCVDLIFNYLADLQIFKGTKEL